MDPAYLLVVATILPLFGFGFTILLSRLFGRQSAWHWFTVGVVGVSFLLSAIALVQFMAGDRTPQCIAWNWLRFGTAADGTGQFIQIGPYVDQVTVLLFAMVTLLSLVVHIYSIGYMEGDPHKTRFMAYLELFTFSMLGIVAANSLLQFFIFWEMVGCSSYLLIGFWYEQKGPQLACKKAWVMNRIGDTGFMVGMGILFSQFGGDLLLRAAPAGSGGIFTQLLTAHHINALNAGPNEWWLTLAGIGIFMGAMGKSAQFPLQTWLPDAMEGPTPVSSILHSATMVAAGVYLTARIFPILTPGARLFVATIGLVTLVMAALIACVQTDIKKVLAYSTLSQLGYMILSLGVGAYTYAIFHLITHAFFKCCLFLCAGSVITAAHHEKEMTKYGGLGKKMPITAACFGISTLAIAGASIPYTTFGISGFYSKDGIIASSFNYGTAMINNGMNWAGIFYWCPLIIAYVTAFYMARAFILTFMGKPRDQHLHDHAHEMNWTMWVPQAILAFFAIVIGWSWFGVGSNIAATSPVSSQPYGEEALLHSFEHFLDPMMLFGFGWIASMAVCYAIYRKGFNVAEKISAIPGIHQIHLWLYNKMGFDGLYDIIGVSIMKGFSFLLGAFDRNVIDGLVNLIARIGRDTGFAIGRFDYEVVDGAVRGSGRSALRIGGIFHRTQSGNIRTYVLILVVTAFAALAIAMPFALGWVFLGMPQ